jgi:DcuC family C4-dicarboxylate transporter
MKEIGLIPAFIDMLKQSNEIARWGASFGPFLLAVLTGSGEAAIWAFNQAVTPSAASFGMNPEALGLLCAVAGQFGRTASPLAGCIIIVAGIAKVSPFEISKRVGLSMLISLIVAALVLV